jgi:CDP-Glycerol:Poly(glycerophosphate) glycerophosphotransferase
VGNIKGKLQTGAMNVALNFLAVISFATLVLSEQRLAGYLLTALALVAIFLRANNLRATVAAQMLLTAGLLVDYERHVDDRAALTTVGVLLALLIINMPFVETVVKRPIIRVANLPGYETDHGLLISPNVLYSANPVWIAVLGVFAAAKLTAWPLIIPVAFGAAAVVTVSVQALRARLRGTQTEKRLRDALIQHGATFALYFTAPDETEYHIEMWRPYLERLGKPWIIVLREGKPFQKVAAACAPGGIPVLFCPLIKHVDDVVTPSLKTVFYVNNGAKNAHMVRFSRMTHIQLLHGDSDKQSSFNPVTAMYNRIFVAGQAGIDRYEANGVLIPRQKFEIVGRPQIETIKVSHTHIRDVTEKVVLYATTWASPFEDMSYSSLRISEMIVRKMLERKVTIVLRPHPYTENDVASARYLARLHQILADDREQTGRAHVFGAAATKDMSVNDCTNAADAMISDVSAVASDFLYSAKPFAMTNMNGGTHAEFEASFPLARAAYVIDKTGSNLDEILDKLLEDDPLEETRREVKRYYLSDFNEDAYADGFVKAAAAYV